MPFGVFAARLLGIGASAFKFRPCPVELPLRSRARGPFLLVRLDRSKSHRGEFANIQPRIVRDSCIGHCLRKRLAESGLGAACAFDLGFMTADFRNGLLDRYAALNPGSELGKRSVWAQARHARIAHDLNGGGHLFQHLLSLLLRPREVFRVALCFRGVVSQSIARLPQSGELRCVRDARSRRFIVFLEPSLEGVGGSVIKNCAMRPPRIIAPRAKPRSLFVVYDSGLGDLRLHETKETVLLGSQTHTIPLEPVDVLSDPIERGLPTLHLLRLGHPNAGEDPGRTLPGMKLGNLPIERALKHGALSAVDRGQRVGVLVSAEDALLLSNLNSDLNSVRGQPVVLVSLASEDDAEATAARLYAALRELDAAHVDVILARDIAKDHGLWRAVRDRLHRAAASVIVVGTETA